MIPKQVARERDETVLAAIISYKITHDGLAPSLRELLALVDLPGVASISQLRVCLNRLEKSGRIKRSSNPCHIQVTGGVWLPPGPNIDALAYFASGLSQSDEPHDNRLIIALEGEEI